MISQSNFEGLLFAEAQRDIEMESRGIFPAAGEMQRCFPEAYQATRELVLAMAESLPALTLSIRQAEKISKMLHDDDEGLTSIQDVVNMQPIDALTLAHLIRLERKRTAENAANSRHNQPGKSWDKRDAIREKWASGKFSSRDICAEEECAELGMSFSAARKALRNTPDPS